MLLEHEAARRLYNGLGWGYTPQVLIPQDGSANKNDCIRHTLYQRHVAFQHSQTYFDSDPGAQGDTQQLAVRRTL